MTELEQKVLNRIRKMMRLAQDAGATEGERDNALRMAHATLAKYNLDISQIEVDAKASGTPDEPRERGEDEFLGKPWALQIAMAIARLYFCHYFYQKVRGNGGPNAKARHCFIGRRSNVAVAKEMSRLVVEAIHKEAGRYQRSVYGSYGTYRAFAQAAGERVYERCQEILKASVAQGPSTGTALVLANVYQIEAKANQAWMADHGIHLGKGRQQSHALGSDARNAGRAYGSTVSLQKAIR